MNQYWKILVSMVGTLLMLCLFIALSAFVSSSLTGIGKNSSDENLFIFLLLIFFGALFMVVPFASILWLLIYKQLSKFIDGERRRHFFSVILSSIFFPLVISIVEAHYIESIQSGYFILLVVVFPVAVLNYFVYQKFYIK